VGHMAWKFIIKQIHPFKVNGSRILRGERERERERGEIEICGTSGLDQVAWPIHCLNSSTRSYKHLIRFCWVHEQNGIVTNPNQKQQKHRKGHRWLWQ
jgi:hypothetical protein